MPGMYLAPHVRLEGHVSTIPSGVAGIRATLRVMREMVRAARVDPDMVSVARSVVFMSPQKDLWSESCALYAFVRDSIRYVQDVLDVETLATPQRTLATRSGDCDDQSTLLATLMECIGIPTRFVVAGYSIPGQFEHVYVQALIAGAPDLAAEVSNPDVPQWMSFDPTEQASPGWEPGDAVAYMVERV